MQGNFYRQPHQWSEALEARLADLWMQGVSGSLIAEQIGKTRSAVMGKVNRLGLPMRKTETSVTPTRKPRAPRAKKPKVQRPPSPETLARLAVIAARQVTVPVADMAIPLEQRKTLLELTPSCCKWPVGDPAQEGFFFCGGVAEMSGPYCPAHARRAYA